MSKLKISFSEKQLKAIYRPFSHTFDVLEGTPRSGKTTAGHFRYAMYLTNTRDTNHLIVAYNQEQAYRLFIDGDGTGLMHIFGDLAEIKHDEHGSHLQVHTPNGVRKVYYKGGGKSNSVGAITGMSLGSVVFSLDNELWHPLQSGGSLSFHEDDWLTEKVVYLRQTLTTTHQTVTPSISGFKYEINSYTLKNKVSTATFVYEEDWNLGDIPTLQNKDWGVTLDSRITEVTEVAEREGIQLSATFGQSRPTLISKIKQELSGMRNEIVR